ncbi:MAG: recombinase family protein [Acidobacteriaceae bacterium]|nr:recombinase family protein [Acidobacteriaceae bacterium]
MNGKFVAYYRVSTDKQGKSGLGLEAQKAAVEDYLNGGRWKLMAECKEVESGKKADRPQLAKALALCRLHKATLLVAKLDRLARNVYFISSLMESGVKFVACDMPDINEMVVHILASVAQGEAKAISDRTKAALAASKARGTKLGGRRVSAKEWGRIAIKGRETAIQARQEKASEYRSDVLPFIQEMQSNGVSTLRAIAEGLNQENIVAPRGGKWTATQVMRILKA